MNRGIATFRNFLVLPGCFVEPSISVLILDIPKSGQKETLRCLICLPLEENQVHDFGDPDFLEVIQI